MPEFMTVTMGHLQGTSVPNEVFSLTWGNMIFGLILLVVGVWIFCKLIEEMR